MHLCVLLKTHVLSRIHDLPSYIMQNPKAHKILLFATLIRDVLTCYNNNI